MTTHMLFADPIHTPNLCGDQEVSSLLSRTLRDHSPLDQVSNTFLFQLLPWRRIQKRKTPHIPEEEEEENLTKTMVFNGIQKYGYNYIVRNKKPVGDQELEGYKIMG